MLAATLLLATSLAHAGEDPAGIRMTPNRMLLPTVGVELAALTTFDPEPMLRGSVSLRGIPERRRGRSWLPVSASAMATPERLVAWDTRAAIYRHAGESNPVVAASDVRFGNARLYADHDLGVAWDASATAVDWTGGLYLPAMFPGDLDARLFVGARALGARWRRFDDGSADFVGGEIAGITGELAYGRKFTPGFTLTARLGGQADWSIGDRAGFTLLTDTEAWVGGDLGMGPHHDLRLLLGTRTLDDDRSAALGEPTVSLAWRAAW